MCQFRRWLALAVASVALVAPVHAGLITYNFAATITNGGVLGPLVGSGIGPGDQVLASIVVNGAVVPSGTATYQFFDQAILGGTVTVGGLHWTLGGSGENYAVVWNDEPIGGGTIFDGLWLQTPLHGPSLSSLAPDYFGLVLFSYEQTANDALNNAGLPLALELGDFNGIAAGSMAFRDGDSVGRFGLVIDTVTIGQLPTPGTLVLLGSALAMLAMSRRRLPGRRRLGESAQQPRCGV